MTVTVESVVRVRLAPMQVAPALQAAHNVTPEPTRTKLAERIARIAAQALTLIQVSLLAQHANLEQVKETKGNLAVTVAPEVRLPKVLETRSAHLHPLVDTCPMPMPRLLLHVTLDTFALRVPLNKLQHQREDSPLVAPLRLQLVALANTRLVPLLPAPTAQVVLFLRLGHTSVPIVSRANTLQT